MPGCAVKSSIQVANADVEVLDNCPLCGADSIAVLDSTANLCECKQCEYVFDNPRPTLAALITFYSQPTKYDQWLAEEAARDALWARRLKILRAIAKPGSLLDIGTGIGQLLAIARPFFSDVCGTEVSESAINIARQKYNLQLLAGEIQTIDFGSKKFDNITIFHVLEHVPNPRDVIEKCASLLVDGGTLTIAVPNDLYSWRGKRFLRTFVTRRFGRLGRVGLAKIVVDGSMSEIHLSHFTPRVLGRILEQSGFSVIARTLDPYYVAVGFAERWEAGFYLCCRILNRILGTNVYDTMLLIGRKTRPVKRQSPDLKGPVVREVEDARALKTG